MEKMLISNELYDMATRSGLLVGNEDNTMVKCVDDFTKLILRRCIEIIDSQYIKGDLSERANGIRMARDAIIKNFE